MTPLSRNDEAILKVFSASWQWFSISGLDFWSWSYSIYVKTMFNFFSQPQESYIVRKAEIVNWYNFAKTSKKWSTFFLKLMHIQYGGRYQHILTYSGHNNALRITYQRANLLWHCFDGKTPRYCFENNWFVIPGQPGEGEGKAFRYEKDVPNAILLYIFESW